MPTLYSGLVPFKHPGEMTILSPTRVKNPYPPTSYDTWGYTQDIPCRTQVDPCGGDGEGGGDWEEGDTADTGGDVANGGWVLGGLVSGNGGRTGGGGGAVAAVICARVFPLKPMANSPLKGPV